MWDDIREGKEMLDGVYSKDDGVFRKNIMHFLWQGCSCERKN
jgi:hypothetical protein